MKSLCHTLILLATIGIIGVLNAQSLYFPPLDGDSWETMFATEAGYCDTDFNSLDSLLEAANSKAFILLKDGKIVHEQYFDSFTKDSLWVWNSASKTLTAALVGIAVQEGQLDINDMTSVYLGTGWTSAPQEKEDKITIWHQLTMTSGLDYATGDPYCTEPSCLIYLADAGTRWSYHNGPYTLLDNVLLSATGQSLNTLFRTKIRDKTGITGLFFRIGYNNAFLSKPRSMARFGLLTLNKGMWDGTPILSDTAYIRQSTTTSQSLNPSYGYLWWLNGKSTYRLPGSQVNFPGPISPSAPSDAVAAIGKDGQIICVIPSTNEVWIRMGNKPEGASQLVASVLFEDISKAIKNERCTSSPTAQPSPKPTFRIQTNPVGDQLQLAETESLARVEIIDTNGRRMLAKEGNLPNYIDVSHLANGTYTVIGWSSNGDGIAKRFLKVLN